MIAPQHGSQQARLTVITIPSLTPILACATRLTAPGIGLHLFSELAPLVLDLEGPSPCRVLSHVAPY